MPTAQFISFPTAKKKHIIYDRFMCGLSKQSYEKGSSGRPEIRVKAVRKDTWGVETLL